MDIVLEITTVELVEGSAGAVSMQRDNRSIPRSPFLDGRCNIFSTLSVLGCIYSLWVLKLKCSKVGENEGKIYCLLFPDGKFRWRVDQIQPESKFSYI